MKSPNCLAIIAILAEMVKRVKENIAKVDLQPLPLALQSGAGVKRKAAGKAKKV